MKIIVRAILVIAAGALALSIVWAMGADGRSLGAVISDLLGQPWAVVTLIDLYLGFFIAAVVIALAERRWWLGCLWALPVFVLGNVWTAVWMIVRLPDLARRLRRRD